MQTLNNSQFLGLILEVLKDNGCDLADIDFETKVIHLEGSAEDKVRCALALQDILD